MTRIKDTITKIAVGIALAAGLFISIPEAKADLEYGTNGYGTAVCQINGGSNCAISSPSHGAVYGPGNSVSVRGRQVFDVRRINPNYVGKSATCTVAVGLDVTGSMGGFGPGGYSLGSIGGSFSPNPVGNTSTCNFNGTVTLPQLSVLPADLRNAINGGNLILLHVYPIFSNAQTSHANMGAFGEHIRYQAPCNPTSWSPDLSTVCSGQAFTQTSNCGTTRTAYGTKNCCAPNCSNAPNVCSGQWFSDGCGGNCWGTRNCCTPSCANAPNVCSGQWFGDGCGGNCWGTKNCTPPPTLNFWADSTNLAYNGSTTLRWNSTNATSCTASGDWSGGKALSGAEGTGNLTSTRTYYLTCSGPGQPPSVTRSVTVNVALPPLGSPTGLQASCNAAGNQVTLRWNGVAGATMYPIRVDDQTTGWDGSCTSPDECSNIYATSYTRAVVPGRTYGWWVHAYRAADGAGSGAAIGADFRCNAPVTVSGRVINQSTGAGMAGVSIPVCTANPGATTNASGNFSFTVPYGADYCIRLNPQDRAGMTGPVPTGYPLSLQATMKSYEFQRAGVNCAATGCGGAWDTYDRSTDTGFDFAYTNITPRLIICPATASITVGDSVDLNARYWANLASVPDCNTVGYTPVTPSSTWTSVSTAIARVDDSGAKGRVTGVSAGTATISALYSGITATRNVTVTCVFDGGIVRTNLGPPQCTDSNPTCTRATCERTVTGTATCLQTYTDNCGDPQVGTCQNNTCTPPTLTCPKCPKSYKEVTP